MVDMTQPATAAEFQAMGVDEATAAGLAAQANLLAGRGPPEERAALLFSLNNQPPPAKPPAAPSTVTPAEATAALQAHADAQLSAHFDQFYAPPQNAHDYR